MGHDGYDNQEPLRSGEWLAEYIGVKIKTLEAWRCRGQGPPFVKIGRLVRYRKSDVDSWVESRTKRNTSRE